MDAVKQSRHLAMVEPAWALMAARLPAGAPAALPPLAPNTPAPAASTLPVLAWLDDLPALAESGTRPLVEQLVAAAPALAWRRTYDARNAAPAFLARYGWTELVGPHGGCAADTLRLGFLLLGPDTLYPAHAHAAEELYQVLAGTADWRRDRAHWHSVPPGGAIHHPPNISHAMRTSAEPLLALYLWWGADVVAPARMAGPDRTGGEGWRTP
jgi:mannose-6-phosphate isomerase-like protein (cupin superfamily)